MLKVSDNRRFLVRDDGSPFFYLADTGWTLFQKLDREEALLYMRDRAAKGFTALQVMGIAEDEGLTRPNRYGDLPLDECDPKRPSDGYFRHVDWVVDQLEALGMYLALLPTWGDKVGPIAWGKGPEIFTSENAALYGEFLGERYRDKPVIWVLGGDRNPVDERYRAAWRAMAQGIKRGDAGRGLMTFHPEGPSSSSAYFHGEPWLDFNMIQSGHAALNNPTYSMIAHDYALQPPKPCMDGEPNYEDHPINWKDANGRFDDYDVRKAAYWSLFAGAHGHTYGALGVWQFWRADEPDRFGARTPWYDALKFPGAAQMGYLRSLIEARPFLQRVPDQGLVVSDTCEGGDHIQATRDQHGSYAFVYIASGKPVTLNLSRLSGSAIVAHWYDPRTGRSHLLGELPKHDAHTFEPPSSGPGNDWVLVLDDAALEFPGLRQHSVHFNSH